MTHDHLVAPVAPHIKRMTNAEVLSLALLLGFECRRVEEPDTPGYRWNSGTFHGEWARTPADAARAFLDRSDFNRALTRQYSEG